MLQVFPDYNKLDRAVRLEMKKRVLKYLKNRLGDALNACMLKATAQETVFTTFGVPKFLEEEFKEWAKQELPSVIKGIEVSLPTATDNES